MGVIYSGVYPFLISLILVVILAFVFPQISVVSAEYADGINEPIYVRHDFSLGGYKRLVRREKCGPLSTNIIELFPFIICHLRK